MLNLDYKTDIWQSIVITFRIIVSDLTFNFGTLHGNEDASPRNIENRFRHQSKKILFIGI